MFLLSRLFTAPKIGDYINKMKTTFDFNFNFNQAVKQHEYT